MTQLEELRAQLAERDAQLADLQAQQAEAEDHWQPQPEPQLQEEEAEDHWQPEQPQQQQQEEAEDHWQPQPEPQSEPQPQQEADEPQPEPQQPRQPDVEFAAAVQQANRGGHWREVHTFHYLSTVAQMIGDAVPGLTAVDPRFSLSPDATYTLHDLLAKQEPSLSYVDAYTAASAAAPGVLPPLTGECRCVTALT